MAAMWKDENAQRPGPKTEDEKVTAQRCAAIGEGAPDVSPTRAAAVQTFNVSRRAEGL